MKDSDFDVKIESQLGDPKHYLPLIQNPSNDYTSQIESWANKWINKKAIPETILKFVVNRKATLAKAKGLIKSHKEGNPTPLLLSGCNTAIENLSIFVDYYLTPLAKKLPSFIQDSTDFLNKLLELDYKPTESTLLVSFDVVNMFPNIDNNLGIKAVKKALNSRKDKSPPTNCILEATKLCLELNNCRYLGKDFLQIHGTAMGPHNACSYADLSMGEFDDKALNGYKISPQIWWRFRDDIFSFWEHGEEALMEFLEFLNAIYPTIKFTVNFSTQSLEFLDVLISIQNDESERRITTSVYSKPTNVHQYIMPNSSTPKSSLQGIAKGVATRIRRICSDEADFQDKSKLYQKRLVDRGYNEAFIANEFSEVAKMQRKTALTRKQKNNKEVTAWVVDYNPRLPSLNKFIKKSINKLYADEQMKKCFPEGSLLVSHKKTPNLKQILVDERYNNRNKAQNLPANNQVNETALEKGIFLCNRKCQMCQKQHLIPGKYFRCTVTKKSYAIRQHLDCNVRNVIYLITCNACQKQYVGSTTNLKTRFANYKSNIKLVNKSCTCVQHFGREHNWLDFRIQPIEKVYLSEELQSSEKEKKLLARERYWMAELRTIYFGLNDRDDLRLDLRRNFKE